MLRKLEAGDYYGSTVQLFAREGLSIADTHFAANLIIPPHEHSNAFFCFVLDGHGTRSWPSRAGNDSKMELTFFPAEMPHANCWHDTRGRVLHIEFARSWLERREAQIATLNQPRDFARGRPMWTARQLFDELQHPDEVTSLAAEGLVLELLAACARAPAVASTQRAPKWLDDIQSQLHDRFAERISLVELARSAGVSADHLIRTFRRHHGCTVGDYLRDLRIDFVRRQLEHTHDSLTAIAATAGFADQSHLIRIFRRKLGVTPSQYRAMYRTDRPRSSR